ncbi:MAG: mechanosensitive ion channel domain-containing protein [Bacteroidota bacterium]
MEKYSSQLINLASTIAPKIVMAILTLVIGFWFANKLSKILKAVLTKRKIDIAVTSFLASIVSSAGKIMVLISVAGIFGIETTSFVALIGAAGIAIGLALQGSLSHFASGVMILIFKPFQVGDLIQIGEHTGNVEDIQIFNTVLRTLDNRKIILPNGAVTSGAMVNISGQGTIRVDMRFGVSNIEDIDKVRAAIQQVADGCPKILKNPAIDILVNSQDVGITKYDVRPWVNSEDYWEVYYYMQENVKRQFELNKIAGPKSAIETIIKR